MQIRPADTYRRPKVLVIGHARHGKDTVAEQMTELMGLKFISSSMFVAEEIIWPLWGKERYATFGAMFDDRVNYRSTWFNLIAAYNTPDMTKTASTMFQRGYDIYVGMRRRVELEACKADGLFDVIIWVDRSKHHPPEELDSMELRPEDADVYLDNNGTLGQLNDQLIFLQHAFNQKGYDVGELKLTSTGQAKIAAAAKKADEDAWTFIPEGATPVLDHGFIILRDHMGDDHEIAESARMSYGRGTKKVNNDAGLLRYLMLNRHTSPFEMAEIKVHMRLPVFVMRQWVRHRTANLNEYSGRYSEMPRLFYIPRVELICEQHDVNKQGSGDPLPVNIAQAVQATMRAVSNKAFDDYELMLKSGVSRESARIILPLNTYTEIVWKIDINNLVKMLLLRDDDHAQWEIQVYAKELDKIFAKLFPETYAVYRELREQINLTKPELLAIVTNNPEASSWGLGKGQIAKVKKILEWVFKSVKKPD
jgi:thymidylate synthase (FAD)